MDFVQLLEFMANSANTAFTEIQAANLAQRDSFSDSDPYVVFLQGGTELVRTEFLRNVLGRSGGRSAGSDAIAVWSGQYTATVDQDSFDQP